MKSIFKLIIILNFITLGACVKQDEGSTGSSSSNNFSIRKIVDNLLPKSESTIYFTVAVTNSTSLTYKNVEILETCPDGSVYESDNPFVGTYNTATNLWVIDELESGELASLQIGCTLLHELSGQTVGIPQTQLLSPSNIDIEYSSSSVDQITVLPISANVVTTLTVNKAVALEEEVLNYTVLASNSGPDSATNLSMSFSCPAGSVYQSHNAETNTTYNNSTGEWSIGTILRSNSATLVVQCKVSTGSVTLSGSVNGISSNSQDSDATGDTLVTSSPVETQCNADLTGITSYNYIGDGLSTATAFEIGNTDQLIDLSNNGSADWDKEFILCQNLDFTGVTTFSSISDNSSTPFTGVLNGNSRTISNYSTSGEALFGFIQGATIRDLTFATSTHVCNSDYCGLLVDQAIGSSSTSTLTNITIASSVAFTNSRRYAAPVIGYVNDTTVSMTNVSNDASITVDSHANITATDSFTGGVVGYANNAGLNFSIVSNSGNFTSDSGYIGGVVGVGYLNKSSSLDQVTNSGNFNVTQTGVTLEYLGGLSGRFKANSGSGVVNFTNSSSTGAITTAGVSAYNYLGGLFGSVGGQDASNYINADTLSISAVTIDNDAVASCSYTGGIFGYLGQGGANNDATTIANSTSAATVLGCNYTGGFGGSMRLATSVATSSASGSVTGTSITGGFVGSADFNSSISGSDYTGSAVTGTTIVGGYAGRLGYDVTTNTTASITNSDVTTAITLTSAGESVGGFVGTQYNSSSITNSTVSIGVFNITNSDNIGGFVGNMDMNNILSASATINNCQVIADGITFSTAARNSVGGFVGSIRNGGATVSNSTTNFDPNGESYVGGFVGFVQGNSADPSNRITMSTNTSEGDVTCSGTQCGGFVGRALRIGTISNSTVNNSAGQLSSTGSLQDHMGGFVGYIGDDFIINGSTTNLDVDSLGEFVGGFAGYLEGNADITDSSVTSDTVVGDNIMGGFIGKVECTTTSVNADGRCDLLRNYVTLTSITHHTPATTSSYYSSGFAADVRTSDNDSEIYIEDSFSVVGTINSNFHAGGFVGIAMLEGDSGASGDKIYIRRNYVGPGTLQAGAAIDAVDFGGFIGLLSGSSSLNQGEVYIEDNYTALTTIDTSNFNAGSFFVGVGGFIGTDESFVGSSLRRNYTSVQTISGNESARHIGGFIGTADQPGAGFTDSSYIDNFTTTNTVGNSPFEASFFYGILDGTVSPTESGNFYQSGVTCVEADEVTSCSARLTESGVALGNFQDDNTNAPLTNWDFTNTWQARTGELPALRCSTLGSTAFCTAWDANQ